MKTYLPNPEDAKAWHVIDAEGKILGRIAAEAASLLRGKHKPTYTPFLDCGDHVIIINAEKIKVSGTKSESKIYYNHSGYPGGLRETPLREMMEKHPERALQLAIKGMLPHNRLGRKLATNFRVYAGAEHPHQAQMPQPREVR